MFQKTLMTTKNFQSYSDKLTKPEFLNYKKEEREWYINTLEHFLKTDENFDSVFYLFDTYFDDEITDQRQFMKILLECLNRYHAEAMQNES